MPLFTLKSNKLTQIREEQIKLEQEIQSITENNLDEIFGLKMIKHEFQLHKLRIDTLAFDPESNSFVIIEYKRGRSFSVVDQGFAYLSLMLNNKAEFILEYNESQNKTLKRNQIDWSQTRIIFVASAFTVHQQNAINFRDLPIELWEFKKYSNSTLLFSQIKADQTVQSINTVSAGKTVQNVSREIKSYSIDSHFKPGRENSHAIFEELSEGLLSIDPRIEERPVKHYIGYRIDNRLFCNIQVYKSKLVLELYRIKPHDINDPEKRVSYIEGSMENKNKYVSKFNILSVDDIPYALMLAKQVFHKTYN